MLLSSAKPAVRLIALLAMQVAAGLLRNVKLPRTSGTVEDAHGGADPLGGQLIYGLFAADRLYGVVRDGLATFRFWTSALCDPALLFADAVDVSSET